MGNSLFDYIRQLELLAFFSGYPLIYALVHFAAGKKDARSEFQHRVVSVLPYSYALVGTLFLGMQLRNMYPYYSFQDIRNTLFDSWLIACAVLSILFWLPVFAKRPVLTLFHSLVFFGLLVKDLVGHFSGQNHAEVLKNDMKLYTDSMLLNLFCLLLVFAVTYIIKRTKRKAA